MGSTVLTIYGQNKRLLATVNITVSADLDSLKARLHQIFPPKMPLRERREPVHRAFRDYQ